VNTIADEAVAADASANRPDAGRPSVMSLRQIACLSGVLAVLWAVSLAFLLPSIVTTDVGWYLFATRKWLEGAELYHDLMEVNPPLAFYVTVPATLVEMAGWLDEQRALFVYVAALIAVSLGWSLRYVLRMPLNIRETCVLALAIFAAMFLVPFADFGQREQLAMVFAMPYVIMSALPASARVSLAERFTVGAFAVLGLALKPYFLAVPAMVAFARIASARSLSKAPRILFAPEHLAIALGCLAYLALIWLRHPAYLETVLPLASRFYISVGHQFAVPMKIAGGVLFFAFPLVLAMWVRPAGDRDGALAVVSAAAVGFLISYLVQGKAWHYQIVPVVSCAIVAAAVYAGDLLRPGRPALPAAVLAFAMVVGIADPLIRSGGVHSDTERLLATYRDRLEGRRIAGWSSVVQTGFPLVNLTDADWTVRYPHLWSFYGAMRFSAQTEDPQLRHDARNVMADARRQIVDDLVVAKPDIVLVETYLGDAFLDYLSGDERFTSAFGPYRRIGTIGETEIWQRTGG
jgi:hypothetical protein